MMRWMMCVPLFSLISFSVTSSVFPSTTPFFSDATMMSPSARFPAMKSMMFWKAKVPVLFTLISNTVLPLFPRSSARSSVSFCSAEAFLNSSW